MGQCDDDQGRATINGLEMVRTTRRGMQRFLLLLLLKWDTAKDQPCGSLGMLLLLFLIRVGMKLKHLAWWQRLHTALLLPIRTGVLWLPGSSVDTRGLLLSIPLHHDNTISLVFDLERQEEAAAAATTTYQSHTHTHTHTSAAVYGRTTLFPRITTELVGGWIGKTRSLPCCSLALESTVVIKRGGGGGCRILVVWFGFVAWKRMSCGRCGSFTAGGGDAGVKATDSSRHSWIPSFLVWIVVVIVASSACHLCVCVCVCVLRFGFSCLHREKRIVCPNQS